MSTRRITAVMTHYRNGAFLAEALDSVLQQTRPPDEILLVDDATPAAESGRWTGFPRESRSCVGR